MNVRIVRFCLYLAVCVALPTAAFGQPAAGIAGTVRDTSGAVLPGVTVEVSSPALIEKVRTVVSDSDGLYRILDLRPGTYAVTFSLPGFSLVRREGLELTTGLTVTINAELPLGSIEQAVLVSGAAPIVDVQNSATRNVLTTQVLDSLPVARGLQGFAVLTLGVTATATTGTRDVGGNAGDWSGRLILHGIRGENSNWTGTEGLDTRSIHADGSRRQEINYAALQEVVLNTSAPTAEYESGTISVNLVPKDGGNTFRGAVFGDYTGESLQSSNLNAELRARGVSQSNATKFVYDAYVGLGGPIIKDKLWFYTAHRMKDARQEIAGVYYNKLQGKSPLPEISTTLFYEPDLSRPVYSERPAKQYYHERFTWQAAARHKVTLTMAREENCYCAAGLGPARDPAASWWGRMTQTNFQPGWTYTATDRLLVEGGFNRRMDLGHDDIDTVHNGGVARTDRTMMDIGLGIWYGSATSGNNPNIGNGNGWLTDYGDDLSRIWSGRVAVSYVSGAHAFKAGVSNQSGWLNYGPGTPNFSEAYQLRNRVPSGLWQVAGPGFARTALKSQLGTFAQDQWTTGRVTVNMGVRFDYINAYAPATVRPAGKYTPELSFAKLPNLPNWKDITPRLGVVYDPFGDGRTALKATLGKYVISNMTRIARDMNPADQIAGTVFRTWSDSDNDFIPDCDLRSPLANGECGLMANQRFGTAVSTSRYAEDFLTGWGKRGYNWQWSVSAQRELMPRVAVSAGFFRTINGNIEFTDNQALTPADFDPFCITAPADSRLPGGGGGEICGLYDVKPEKFGFIDNVIRASDTYREIYNGVDLLVNARFGRGGLLTGGGTIGTTTLNQCGVVDTPDQRFCKNSNSQHQLKLAGVYPLPWDLQFSASLQNLPGVNRLANLVVSNAQVLPSLRRNLGACRGAAICNATVTVPLIEPGTAREPRQTQLDLRFTRLIRAGRLRIEPKFELFNALNANDPQSLNVQYGPTWPAVGAVLAGRLFKFGAMINF